MGQIFRLYGVKIRYTLGGCRTQPSTGVGEILESHNMEKKNENRSWNGLVVEGEGWLLRERECCVRRIRKYFV